MRIVCRTLMILSVILSVSSCTEQKAPQWDIVLELAKTFEEIADRDLARGRVVYGKFCSVCHGVEGRGDGFNAYNLDPKPRNFVDSSFRVHLDSTLIMETISSGGPAVGLSPLMPAWGRTISESDLKRVCYYVMYLARVGDE